MLQLLLIRDRLKSFFRSYKTLIIPIFRFFAAFISYRLINSQIGYYEKITGIVPEIGLSVVSAFFPSAVTVFFAAALTIAHIFSASMFLSVIFIMIIAVLYFMLIRFAPKYGWVVLAIPVLSLLKLGAAVPLTLGLIATPITVFAVIPGVVVASLFNIIKEAVKLAAGSTELEDNLQNYIFVAKSLVENKAMFLMIASSVLVLLTTYFLRRLALAHTSELGILAGMIVNLIVNIAGGLVLGVQVDMVWVFLGTVFSGIIAYIVKFFKFMLDYTAVEHLQFDDDDYYYYVTAIPKLSVTSPNLNILKINDSDSEKEQAD